MPLANSKSSLVLLLDFSQLLEKSSTSSWMKLTPSLWQARNLSMQRTIRTVFALSLPCVHIGTLVEVKGLDKNDCLITKNSLRNRQIYAIYDLKGGKW